MTAPGEGNRPCQAYWISAESQRCARRTPGASSDWINDSSLKWRRKLASQSTLLGAAGEYHVMAELLRRGYIAALAPHGVPNADIVVTDVDGTRLCSIQVKTRRNIGSDGGWHMKAKHEAIRGDRLFYCFVDFGKTPDSQPIVYVLPSVLVAEVLASSHRQWLKTPGMKGQAHNDGPMRRLLPDYTRLFGAIGNPYPKGWLDLHRDAWHLLNLEPSAVDHEGNAE
jgi:hypothetical protein